MPCSALANLILFEKLLEEQGDFEEELFNSALVASARAVFCHVFSATVALAVMVGVSMICRWNDFLLNKDFTANRAVLTFSHTGFGASRGD